MAVLNKYVEVRDEEVNAALKRILSIGTSPARFLGAVGNLLANSTADRVRRGVAPDGKAYAPVLRGGSPLNNTGVHIVGAVHSEVRGNTVFVGVPFGWVAVHQWGKTIVAKAAPYLIFKIGNRWARKRSVTIPARPIFGISNEDRAGIVNIITRMVQG